MKNIKGLTLIEVLVASVLLLITIGAILFAFVNQQRIVLKNKRQIESIEIIDRHFEIMSNLDRASLIIDYFGEVPGPAEMQHTFTVVLDNGDSLDFKLDLKKDMVYIDDDGSAWKEDQSVYKIEAQTSWVEDGETFHSQKMYMMSKP